MKSPVCGVVDQGRPCALPVAYRCVVSWTPLIDMHTCATHRPNDEQLFASVTYVGEWDVSGTVVSLEALRERRKLRMRMK